MEVGNYQSAGISDLVGCVNGRYVAIEVKTPETEETVTKLQKEFIDEIIEAGGIAFMASSPQMAITKLKLGLKDKKYRRY